VLLQVGEKHFHFFAFPLRPLVGVSTMQCPDLVAGLFIEIAVDAPELAVRALGFLRAARAIIRTG
jgi:hypothetical protein